MGSLRDKASPGGGAPMTKSHVAIAGVVGFALGYIVCKKMGK